MDGRAAAAAVIAVGAVDLAVAVLVAVGAAVVAASAAAARRDVGSAAMNIKRLLRHFLMTRWYVHSVFPAHILNAIEQAVRQAEFTHGGEIRFAVEGELSTAELFADLPPRERALQVFSQLRVWDTAQNNGVLIYVCWPITMWNVADEGFVGRVSNEDGRLSVIKWKKPSNNAI